MLDYLEICFVYCPLDPYYVPDISRSWSGWHCDCIIDYSHVGFDGALAGGRPMPGYVPGQLPTAVPFLNTLQSVGRTRSIFPKTWLWSNTVVG